MAGNGKDAGRDLRKAFGKERKRVVRTDGKAARALFRAVSIVRYALCAALAATGVLTLAHPLLRQAFLAVFTAFLAETGIM